jgi:hypothetical protein
LQLLATAASELRFLVFKARNYNAVIRRLVVFVLVGWFGGILLPFHPGRNETYVPPITQFFNNAVLPNPPCHTVQW